MVEKDLKWEDATKLRLAAQAYRDGQQLPSGVLQLSDAAWNLLDDQERQLLEAAKVSVPAAWQNCRGCTRPPASLLPLQRGQSDAAGSALVTSLGRFRASTRAWGAGNCRGWPHQHLLLTCHLLLLC